MSFPREILNPDSMAEVLVASCHQGMSGEGPANNLENLVETLLLFIPLDGYEALLREFGSTPGGKHLQKVIERYISVYEAAQ